MVTKRSLFILFIVTFIIVEIIITSTFSANTETQINEDRTELPVYFSIWKYDERHSYERIVNLIDLNAKRLNKYIVLSNTIKQEDITAPNVEILKYDINEMFEKCGFNIKLVDDLYSSERNYNLHLSDSLRICYASITQYGYFDLDSVVIDPPTEDFLTYGYWGKDKHGQGVNVYNGFFLVRNKAFWDCAVKEVNRWYGPGKYYSLYYPFKACSVYIGIEAINFIPKGTAFCFADGMPDLWLETSWVEDSLIIGIIQGCNFVHVSSGFFDPNKNKEYNTDVVELAKKLDII